MTNVYTILYVSVKVVCDRKRRGKELKKGFFLSRSLSSYCTFVGSCQHSTISHICQEEKSLCIFDFSSIENSCIHYFRISKNVSSNTANTTCILSMNTMICDCLITIDQVFTVFLRFLSISYFRFRLNKCLVLIDVAER